MKTNIIISKEMADAIEGNSEIQKVLKQDSILELKKMAQKIDSQIMEDSKC